MELFGKFKKLSSFQLIIFGFMAVILIGSFILMLPVSRNESGSSSFMDALFTATSAVCVTGLIVHDTATYWSEFGQFVIMALIQIGGIGVITVAISITIFSGKKIGLVQRSTMQEAISAPQVGGIVRLTGFILKGTLIIEAIGAAVMAPVFCRDFGIGKGLWYSIFHSVSAFCNAGFDLMGVKEPLSSLTTYQSNPIVNLAIIFLIIIGGLGFLTWNDIKVNKFHIKKYRMQSKIIITVTAILILLPAIYFFFCEFSNEKWEHLSVGDKILCSLFQAVTPRTAGFNTVDLNEFSQAGQAIIVILMLIGGSPGSTAGGMKTTTIAVLIVTMIAVFRRRESAQCFGRRFPPETIRNAATILMMYIILFLFGGIFISTVDGLPIQTAFFEAASAVGTVGLSLGVTSTLCGLSKIVLIILMYLGRVGGLTVIFAVSSRLNSNISKLPLDKITVG